MLLLLLLLLVQHLLLLFLYFLLQLPLIGLGIYIMSRYDPTTFYSWIGGVLKPFRKQGIGAELARLQEQKVKEKNYTKLRTKSMNKYKSMMILNLKNGFDIVKIYTNKTGQTKLIFEKNL